MQRPPVPPFRQDGESKEEFTMNIDLSACAIGIEFGSTRIKAVLTGPDHTPLATGSYGWENRMEDGVWVYHLEDVVTGMRACYRALREDAERKLGCPLRRVGAIGISGMMHGYLVLGRDFEQIAPFRTWRNTITAQAAAILSARFGHNIPQRWSVAHLYQAILNGEEHVPQLGWLVTLSVYVHHLLTGRMVVGVGEASGMLAYNEADGGFDRRMVQSFDELIAPYGFPWRLEDVLPEVLPAGADAGCLTAEGARLLDESGTLEAGIPFCPPEGDAATGMVATNAVYPRSGSISAGTSGFVLLVLEQPLTHWYPEVDVVATPTGKPVAMAHCNTCTTEIDAWARLFADLLRRCGQSVDMNALYQRLYTIALEGRPDGGGMVAFNYYSGEPLSETAQGRPMLVRLPDAEMDLANLMRAQLYGALATLRLGIDLLRQKENVRMDRLIGHGGFFKTPHAGQQILADVFDVPAVVLETAGEGGPWGMAMLAAYRAEHTPGQTLEDFLRTCVFADTASDTLAPDPAGVAGFARYFERYCAAIPAQHAAADMT